jgi:hypothetical protein
MLGSSTGIGDTVARPAMRRDCQRGGFMPDINSSTIGHNPISPNSGFPPQSGDPHVPLSAGSPSASSSGGVLNDLSAMQRRPGNNKQPVHGPLGSQQAEGPKQGRLQRLREQFQNVSQNPQQQQMMFQMMQNHMQTQQQFFNTASQFSSSLAEGMEKAAR